MKVSIVGFTGRAGSGKDTIAKALIDDRRYQKRSLAEPLYRIMKLEVAKQGGDLAAPFELFKLTVDLMGGPGLCPPVGIIAQIVEGEYTKIANETGLMDDVRHGTKPRKFLQYVGTDFFRKYDEDVWVNYFVNQVVAEAAKEREEYLHAIESGEHRLESRSLSNVVDDSEAVGVNIPEPHIKIVITDVRFDNEAEMLYRLVERLNSIAPDVHATKHLFKLDLPLDVAVDRIIERDDVTREQVMANMGHASEGGVNDEFVDHTVDATKSIDAICSEVFGILDGVKPVELSVPTMEFQPGARIIDLSQFAKKED